MDPAAVEQRQRLWSSRWECAKDSKRTRRPPRTTDVLPRTVRARACERLRARRRPSCARLPSPRPPPCGARTRAATPARPVRACVREPVATSPAAAGPPTGRQRRGAGDSARRPIGAAADGRRPPAACRSSHTGRRSRATRTPDGRDRLSPPGGYVATVRRDDTRISSSSTVALQ